MYKFVSYHRACWRLCTGSSCLINGGLLSYAFAMQQRLVCRGRHLGNNGRWSVTWRLRFVDVQSVVLQNRRSFDFRKLNTLFLLLTNYSAQSIMLLTRSFPQDSSLRNVKGRLDLTYIVVIGIHEYNVVILLHLLVLILALVHFPFFFIILKLISPNMFQV